MKVTRRLAACALLSLTCAGVAHSQGACDALCEYTKRVLKDAPGCFVRLRGEPRPGTRPRQHASIAKLQGHDCVVMGYLVNCSLGEFKSMDTANRKHAEAVASVKAALPGGWTFSEEKNPLGRQVTATEAATRVQVTVELLDLREMNRIVEVAVSYDALECAEKGRCKCE